MVVVNDDDGVIELINPIITETSDETQNVLEGSIAHGAPRGYVTRPKSVTVSALDRNGNKITIKPVNISYFPNTVLWDGIFFAFVHRIDTKNRSLTHSKTEFI